MSDKRPQCPIKTLNISDRTARNEFDKLSEKQRIKNKSRKIYSALPKFYRSLPKLPRENLSCLRGHIYFKILNIPNILKLGFGDILF